MVTDALGTPLAFALTPGQKHDCPQAEPLLEQAARVLGPDEAEQVEAVLADKGYDSDALVACIEALGAEALVPSRTNRKQPRHCDAELYRELGPGGALLRVEEAFPATWCLSSLAHAQPRHAGRPVRGLCRAAPSDLAARRDDPEGQMNTLSRRRLPAMLVTRTLGCSSITTASTTGRRSGSVGDFLALHRPGPTAYWIRQAATSRRNNRCTGRRSG